MKHTQVALKKNLILGFASIMLASGYAFANDSAPQGDFTFSVNASRSEASITAYHGTAKILKLPPIYIEVENRSQIKKPSIPITAIADEAFIRCGTLETVIFPESIRSIGKRAFAHCTSLQTVSLPAGLTRIAEGAFSNCRSLTAVIIPDSVTVIERFAFIHCVDLRTIQLPSSLTTIGLSAFRGCTKLDTQTMTALAKYGYTRAGIDYM